MKKLTPEEQLSALESAWNLNPKLICEACEHPLEIDMSCSEQMAESVSIDMESVGYVQHVVLRCQNASESLHIDNCDYGDCNLDDGDKWYNGYNYEIICHNNNVWVDLWDDRFSDNPTGAKLNKYSGARLLE